MSLVNTIVNCLSSVLHRIWDGVLLLTLLPYLAFVTSRLIVLLQLLCLVVCNVRFVDRRWSSVTRSPYVL